MTGASCERVFQVAHTLGLHARPAGRFVSLASRFQSNVEVARDGDEDGALILTDMFGGTPSNMGLAFLEEHRIEVVTGLNLPMLIKLATMTERKPLEELAAFIKEYGQRNIRVASEILPEGRR